MEKIIFVCTGNICRSPMAEGIFNAICQKYDIQMSSNSGGTGVPLGRKASENSVLACQEIGVDITEHRSMPVHLHEDIDEFSKFCVMEEHHKSSLLSLGVSESKIVVLNEENGGISDPYGCDLKRYRLCRTEIIRAIKQEFFQNKKIKIGNYIL